MFDYRNYVKILIFKIIFSYFFQIALANFVSLQFPIYLKENVFENVRVFFREKNTHRKC